MDHLRTILFCSALKVPSDLRPTSLDSPKSRWKVPAGNWEDGGGSLCPQLLRKQLLGSRTRARNQMTGKALLGVRGGEWGICRGVGGALNGEAKPWQGP